MTETPSKKGPASYFPSIEKTYGQPIDHWMRLLSRLHGKKHMELVHVLQAEHGMGRGHASALVAHFRTQQDAT